MPGLDPATLKKVYFLGAIFLAILAGVLLYVMYSGCRRQETFEDLPNYSVCLDLSTKFQTSVSDICGRICALDTFTETGVAADFETVLNTQVVIPSDKGPAEIQAVFNEGKPERNAIATKQMKAQKAKALGQDCLGSDVTMECFTDGSETLEDWLEIQKSMKDSLKKLKTVSIVLFKWISPNVRGYGKKAGVEGFADYSGLQEFMNSCPSTETMAPVPDDLKKKIYSDLIKNQNLLTPIIKELQLCEVLQQKMTEKKKRLESGQLDDSDIAMGSQNSPAAL
jgi:hypothetical protein